jgi:hypothetical protein
VEFEVNPGDLVLLSTKNLRQPGPGVKKLKPSYMDPFEVDDMVGNVAVKLNLPSEWTHIHNVFHVDLVKPYLQGSGDQPSTDIVLSHQLRVHSVNYAAELVHTRRARNFSTTISSHEPVSNQAKTWIPELSRGFLIFILMVLYPILIGEGDAPP